MSQGSLSQRTEESSTFEGTWRLGFGGCFLFRVATGTWAEGQHGTVGCGWLSWAIWSPESQGRVREDKQPGLPFLLDSGKIYYVAVLNKLYKLYHQRSVNYTPFAQTWRLGVILDSPFTLISQSSVLTLSASLRPSAHLCGLPPHLMSVMTVRPDLADCPASSHPKCPLNPLPYVPNLRPLQPALPFCLTTGSALFL